MIHAAKREPNKQTCVRAEPGGTHSSRLGCGCHWKRAVIYSAAGTGRYRRATRDRFALRRAVALADRNIPLPVHVSNGDEVRYPNRIGSFSKGLPHSSTGEVDSSAYNSLLTALTTGRPEDFENIAMGGTVRLVNPQAGLAV